ncbi:MAG: VWA domain-containing protein, partial [Verrucomicrobiota bacterium]
MSINFLNPQLLWLLLLGVVPLLLHLFARSKPPKYQFSSVEFLRRIMKQSMRMKKPQDLLLLILRTLAVLALVGMIIRPLLFSQAKLSGLFQKKNLVIIVDASASMGYVEGGQTRFSKACSEASELLAGLSNRDSANVIWMKSEPESVFPDELGTNFGFLKDRLRREVVTYQRGAPAASLTLAVNMLGEAEGTREICIVSDFQRSVWDDFSPEVPEGVSLIYVNVGDSQAENLAITNITTAPVRPVVGDELAVFVEVANYSSNQKNSTLFCEAGEVRRSQNIDLPAGETTSFVFRHRMNASGQIPVSASLAEDTFPSDDQRFGIVEVRPNLRIGIVEGTQSQTAKIWSRAAQSFTWAVPEWISMDALDSGSKNAADYDIIFFAGTNSPPADLPKTTRSIWLPKVGGGFQLDKSDGSDGFNIQLAPNSQEEPFLEIFKSGEIGDLSGAAGSTRLINDTPLAGKAILAYADGKPSLLRTATGRYTWLTPLDDAPNSFAGRVPFLVFFGEFLLKERPPESKSLLMPIDL